MEVVDVPMNGAQRGPGELGVIAGSPGRFKENRVSEKKNLILYIKV